MGIKILCPFSYVYLGNPVWKNKTNHLFSILIVFLPSPLPFLPPPPPLVCGFKEVSGTIYLSSLHFKVNVFKGSHQIYYSHYCPYCILEEKQK